MAFLERGGQISQPPPAGCPYSIALPKSEQPGRSAVYRHWRFQEGLLKTLDPDIHTAHQAFESAVARVPTGNCLGSRSYDPTTKTFGPYEWMDYATVQRRRANLGAGILEINRQAGITEQKFGVGLWCLNRPEWQLKDLACMSQSLYSVSLYDTLGPSATEYIINHASVSCVATSLPHIPTLLKLKPRLPTLKFIISLDPLENGEQEGHSKHALLNMLAAEVGVKIYSIEQVEAIGASFGPPVYRPPAAEDIITINYTSGTTGPPKGVTLTHRSAIAAATALLCAAPKGPGDVFISYLPLAHIFGRAMEHSFLWAGVAIGYFHGDIMALVDDMKLLRPTTFISVPRLYNRYGGAIRAATTAQPGLKGRVARHIVNTKLAALQDPESPSATNKHTLYDRLWGRKVGAALGLDRVTTMVTGSAPLDPTLHQFFRVVLGNDFVQGYGLTETYAVTLGQVKGDMTAGNCGAVTPINEVCLADVPDMDYLTTDKPYPRGELLIRGNSLFSGYYKNEEETKKAVLPDGWLRSGDIASVDSKGRFTIIDRVKNVLKLAQGEYISPERIENIYLSHLTFLSQAYVHGDSVQTCLVAIFGVLPEFFAPFASNVLGKKVAADDLQAISAACRDVKIRKAVVRELDKVGRKNKFAGYERVKNCYLYLDPFTIDNELLTPTLKLKRPQTARMYRQQLDELYAEVAVEEDGASKVKAKLITQHIPKVTMVDSDEDYAPGASDDDAEAHQVTGNGGSRGRNQADDAFNVIRRTWEDVEEGEDGTITGTIDSLLQQGKRKRTLKDTTPLQRGIIRHLMIIIDLSAAMTEKDLRPTRYLLTIRYCQDFITEFFEQNPISQIGIIGMRDGLAVRVSDMSGNPSDHISNLQALRKGDPKGQPSLQNALDMARAALFHAPSHGTREILLLFGSLISSDPGDIHSTITSLVNSHIATTVIGLSAQVAICLTLVKRTNPQSNPQKHYNVALDEVNYRELIMRLATPPESHTQEAVSDSNKSSLLMMGFPSRVTDSKPGFCACHSRPTIGGYLCSRCSAKVCSLPTTCPACSLTLILSTHLARSYHHLFPLQNWKTVSWSRATHPSQSHKTLCFSCQNPFPAQPTTSAKSMARNSVGAPNDLVRAQVSNPRLPSKLVLSDARNAESASAEPSGNFLIGENIMPHKRRNEDQTVSESGRYQCGTCGQFFCVDCDVFCHEIVHNCPGCLSREENTGVPDGEGQQNGAEAMEADGMDANDEKG
ncbi:MAG: hypothetical protein Q9170_004551 [Blastenia crenularia]